MSGTIHSINDSINNIEEIGQIWYVKKNIIHLKLIEIKQRPCKYLIVLL
jgi:hypothetical protein